MAFESPRDDYTECTAAELLHLGRTKLSTKLSASEQLSRISGKAATAPSARDCLVEIYAAKAELARMLSLKERPSYDKMNSAKGAVRTVGWMWEGERAPPRPLRTSRRHSRDWPAPRCSCAIPGTAVGGSVQDRGRDPLQRRAGRDARARAPRPRLTL